MIDIDLIIAFVIIGIVLAVFLLSKINLLPKKSLPFIIAGLAGAFGIMLFGKSRMNGLRKELEEREKKLLEKEEKLKKLKDNYSASEKHLQQANAELEKQRAAYQKTILQIKAENEEEKERIDRLSGEDLHNEFLEAFGD
jgi:septal ring factor EnvC (AmiA/AmiB activator)